MKKYFLALSLIVGIMSAVGMAAETVSEKMPGISEEKMAEMMKLSRPSEGHRKLDALVGTFKAKTTMRMSAEAPAVTSEGTSETKWILDGHFIQQTFKGEAMGKPFEGVNLIGYDNIAKEYNSIWIDSMSTGMVKATARFDEATKTLKEEGTFSCPLTGRKDNKYKAVTTIVDDDHYKYEMWHDDIDGKNYKAMEITYERQKGVLETLKPKL